MPAAIAQAIHAALAEPGTGWGVGVPGARVALPGGGWPRGLS
jgi:hypothetical protein